MVDYHSDMVPASEVLTDTSGPDASAAVNVGASDLETVSPWHPRRRRQARAAARELAEASAFFKSSEILVDVVIPYLRGETIAAPLTGSASGLLSLLEESRVGAWMLLPNSGEFTASAGCNVAFGLPVSRAMTWADVEAAIHPYDIENWAAARRLARRYGEAYRGELRILWGDGSSHWIEVSYHVVHDVDGSVSAIVGIGADVTSRKVLDHALSGRLSPADALPRSQPQLEFRREPYGPQKTDALVQLTSGVAHDFNNLLTAVMGNLDLLRRRVPQQQNVLRLIDGAMQGVERGANLTQRLLAFARLQNLRPVPVDLGEMLRECVAELIETLAPQVVLQLHLSDGLPPAHADPVQLRAAIRSLVHNAQDAVGVAGQIDISVSTRTIDRDPALAMNEYLLISIRDNGVGMEPPTLRKAVEPFFTTKKVGAGTGLGLSMVHGFAAQLGGILQLTSTHGEGTTATLVLPIARQAHQEVRPSCVRPFEGQALILLVEDDPLVAQSSSDMLIDLGHRVVWVSDARAAAALLRSDQPVDLLMTDYLMPDMNGLELASLSRQVRPDLPVMVVTGFADIPAERDSQLLWLQKPFSQRALCKHLNLALGHQL